MIKRASVFLLVAGLLPLAATADDISFYGGIGVGGSRIEQDANLTVTAWQYEPPAPSTSFVEVSSATLDTFEGTDLGVRLFGGVRLGPYLAIEAGYVDLGEQDDYQDLNIPAYFVSGSTQPSRPETDVSVKMSNEIDGWEVYALGFLPLAERWEGFVKLGLIKWDSKVDIKNQYAETFPPSGPNASFPAIPQVTPPSSKQDFDGVDLAGGIGVNYKASENMILRVEGTWYALDLDGIGPSYSTIDGTDRGPAYVIDDTKQSYLISFDVIIPF